MAIYLDHAAATPIKNEVLETYNKAFKEFFSNPSSPHALGIESAKYLAQINSLILKELGLNDTYEVIHTSGATEANNLAILGYFKHNRLQDPRFIYLETDHPSVTKPMQHLKDSCKCRVFGLGLDTDGQPNTAELELILDDGPTLLSIGSVNSETGFINNLDSILALTKKYSKTVLHCDLVQGFGHVELPGLLDFDLLTLSSHKLGGPKGHGLLIKRKKILVEPIIYGGGQQNNIRSGTEDLAGAIAMLKVIRLSKAIPENVGDFNQVLCSELNKRSDIVINSRRDGSPYIFNFSLLKHKASVVVEGLSLRDVFVSSTSACSSKTNGYSKAVYDVYGDKNRAENTIRLSFSNLTTVDDIKGFLNALYDVLSEVKKNG